ncbi:MAG: ExbD/TolR family protein [Myxococcota bacterium]
MSAARSPLGAGLYFIDVLACLLFCLVLALVGARFGTEQSVPLDLPELAASDAGGPSLTQSEISLRETDAGPELWFDGEPIAFDALARRLREDAPPSVVVRSETSLLSRVVGLVHDAGIREIELAYETQGGGR